MRCIFCNLIRNKSSPTFIAELNSSIAFLNINQNYKGRTVVILKKHERDLLKISKKEMSIFVSDMRKIAGAIKMALNPGRLNYAILGNKVEHLHWHIYPRFIRDKDYGNPPFSARKKFLTDNEYSKLASKIKECL